jgi:hypothetical protein
MFEFLLVWDLLQEMQLHPNVEDQHRWLPSSSGLYSPSSAYLCFHGGANRLARHGMDHPDRCPLCDQQDETVQHILVACVFTREVWFRTLSRLGLQHLAPTSDATVFQEWWREAERNVSKHKKKGFNSIVTLVAWQIWKHRNACVWQCFPKHPRNFVVHPWWGFVMGPCWGRCS